MTSISLHLTTDAKVGAEHSVIDSGESYISMWFSDRDTSVTLFFEGLGVPCAEHARAFAAALAEASTALVQAADAVAAAKATPVVVTAFDDDVVL